MARTTPPGPWSRCEEDHTRSHVERAVANLKFSSHSSGMRTIGAVWNCPFSLALTKIVESSEPV